MPDQPVIDEAALFREMEESLREEKRLQEEKDDGSETTSTCDPESDREDDVINQGKVFYLQNGDVHICRGCRCEFAEMNEDHHLICGMTGVVLAVEHADEPTESVTGRKHSNSPDDHAGEPVGGTWKVKKDMFGLSQQAYMLASQVDGTTQYVHPVEKTPPRPTAKRGALCVDEVPEPSTPLCKRARVNKRDVQDENGYMTLVSEANNILEKLVNYDKKPANKPRNPRVEDARLCDANFLFGAAVKRYVKECLSNSAPPTLDAVHNLAIMAQTVASREREKAAATKTPKILHSKVKQLVSELVVSLWLASCKSTYMDEARRGADSFRPFACGVYYALKRGVALPDGRIVVPSLPESFTSALPALRSTAQHSVAKTLHSSSHRGLCTLHRCVNAVSENKESAFFFNDAARRASDLAHAVKSIQV